MNYRNWVLVIGLLLIAILIGCQSQDQTAIQKDNPVASTPEPPEDTQTPVIVEVTRIVQGEEVEVTRIVQAPEVEVRQPIQPPFFKAEVRTLHSDIMDRDFEVYVGFPDGYAPGNRYKAVYVMDGDYMTMPVWTTAYWMSYNDDIPPVITVGIGYGSYSVDDLMTVSEVDMIERYPDFVQFLKEELIPEIEEDYLIHSNDRVILGYYTGGSVLLELLFNETELFHRYILISSWLTPRVLNDEEIYAESHDDLPVSLYMAVDSLDTIESPDAYSNFYDVLANREYPGLKMELDIREGENWASVIPGAVSNGLRSVFEE